MVRVQARPESISKYVFKRKHYNSNAPKFLILTGLADGLSTTTQAADCCFRTLNYLKNHVVKFHPAEYDFILRFFLQVHAHS